MARQLMAPNQIYSPYQNAPVMGVTGSQAEQNYRTTMKFLSPVQQKLMWPTMIGSMFDPSMFGGMVSRGVGKFAPAATPIFEGLSRTVGGASILIPRMLSDISRSARLPYERQYRRELGTIGGVGSLTSIWSLLNAPGSTARALSMLAGRPDIAKRIPRVENFLTGTGGNVITGKGGAAVEGGGILTAGYRGLKSAADYVTGGKISTALATGAKTGGLAGLASTGVGMIDKGITALLSSSTGVSLGLAAVSVLASIRKSMKMAKLQPNREPPDKFARKFYSSKMANEALNKVMTLAQRGVDPQTLSFMLLQIQIAELQRLNMQVAAFRGEYRSENEFLREEKDKGKDTFEDSYEKEILGQDNRGLISRGLDRLEYGALRLQELNPIYQVSKTVVDLLTGKGFRTSKDRIAELRKFYGYDDEKQLTKEKAEEFGIAIDQAKILHTSSRSIANLAPTFESKKLAFLSAIFDVNRFMLAELMTIRMSGFGIDQNILHRKEPGVFKQFISEMFEKLNPLNLPGINALWNITKGAGKLVGKLIEAPNKLFEMGKNALGSARDFMLGGSYLNLRDKDKWMKAAGLYTPQQERVDNYLGNIFPDQVERIRSVLFDIYYVQEEMLNIMGGKTTKQDERLIWSPIEQKYVTIKSAKVLEESQKIALETAREKAFREGPLGKLLYIVDVLGTPLGKGFFKRLQKKGTVERSLERMLGAEKVIGATEIGLAGEPMTFETRRSLKQILAELSSIKSIQTKELVSLEEIESERQLERVPSSLKWRLGAGIASIGSLLGLILGGPFGLTAAGASMGTYLRARQKREKEIKEVREADIETRNQLERIIEIQEEYFEKAYAERVKESSLQRGFTGTDIRSKITTLNEKMVDYLRVIAINTEMMIDVKSGYLPKIASYLGDNKGSIYELLEPGQRVAEVTIVDKNAEPVLFPPPVAPTNLLPPPTSFANVIPFPVKKEVKVAAKSGGIIPSGEPVLVGEKGPEVLIPDTPGLVVPNEHIKEIKGYDKGGVLSQAPGDYGIFSKIYEILTSIFKVNKETLDIEIYQEKKIEKDAREQTFFEKMASLKQRQDEKKESIWKTDVVDLLKGILKKPISETKAKIKEKANTIWDLLSDLFKNADFLKKILAGLGLAGVGAAILALTDKIGSLVDKLNKFLEMNGISTAEQLKLAGRGILGAGMVVGGTIHGKIPKWKSYLGKSVGGDWTKFGAEEAAGSKAAGKVGGYTSEMMAKEFGMEAGTKEGMLTKIGKSARAGLATAGEFVGKVGGKIKSITGVGPTVSKAITFIEQATSKILGPIGKVISFMGEAFSPLLKLLEPLAKVVGRIALPLQIILTAFDFISDTIQGYKEGGLAGAVKGFFFGKMKDDMETTLGQIGKWAGVGMIAGFPFGGFVGSLAGGLLGAALGATISAVKGAFASYQEGGLWEAIKTFLMGEKEGGLLSAFKTMGPYALAGAVVGFPFGGPIGSLIGGSIGAAIGGLIGWIGQNAITDFPKAMAEWGPNQFIIDNLFTGEGLNYATKFAEFGSIVPIAGPLVGGIIGSVVDLSIYAFEGILSIFGTVSGWLAEANNSIISKQAKGSYAETFAQYGAFTVPIIGPILGAMIGSLVDFGSFVITGLSNLSEKLIGIVKQKYPKIAALLFGDGTTGGPPISAAEAELGVANVGYEKTSTATGGKPPTGVVARHIKEQESRVKNLTSEEAKQAGKVAASQGRTLTQNEINVAAYDEEEKKEYYKYNEAWKAAKTPEEKLALEQKYAEEKSARDAAKGLKPVTPAGTSGGTQYQQAASTAPPGQAQASVIPSGGTSSRNVTVDAALREASQSTDVPLDTLTRIAKAESRLNPRAYNSDSKASGLFQFVPDTWRRMIAGPAGKKYGFDSSTDIFDARANALMGAEYIKQELPAAKEGPQGGSVADIYTLHFLGRPKGLKFFKAIKDDPNQSVLNVIPRTWFKGNESVLMANGMPKSVSDVYRELAGRVAQPVTDEQLARAGGAIGKVISGAKDVAKAVYEKAPQKVKDIFSILTDAFKEIKDALTEAITHQFTDKGLHESQKKDPAIVTEKEVAADVKAASDAKAQEYAGLSSEMEESDKPCTEINEFVRKRAQFILNNKDFQNYYNTHLIATKDGKGTKLSPEDIRTAAETIARAEFVAGVNVPGSIYKFNPETAPFRQFLYDSTKGEGKEVLADYDETVEDIRKRAEAASKAQSDEEGKKLAEAAKQTGGVPTNGGVVAALGGASPVKTATEGVIPSGSLGEISPEEIANFKAMSDDEKSAYFDKNYPPGTPIPFPLRAEAKRLGKLTYEASPVGISKPVTAEQIQEASQQAASKAQLDEERKKLDEAAKQTGGVIAALSGTPPVSGTLGPEAMDDASQKPIEQVVGPSSAVQEVENDNKLFVQRYLRGAELAAAQGMTREEYDKKFSKESLDKVRMWSGGEEAVRLAEIFDNVKPKESGGVIAALSGTSPVQAAAEEVTTSGTLGKISPEEIAKFKAMDDASKFDYFDINYPPGTPIPEPLRAEAKRLGKLTYESGPTSIPKPVTVEQMQESEQQAASTMAVTQKPIEQVVGPSSAVQEVENDNKLFVQRYLRGAELAAAQGMTREEYDKKFSKESLDKVRMWSGGEEAVRLAEIFDNVKPKESGIVGLGREFLGKVTEFGGNLFGGATGAISEILKSDKPAQEIDKVMTGPSPAVKLPDMSEFEAGINKFGQEAEAGAEQAVGDTREMTLGGLWKKAQDFGIKSISTGKSLLTGLMGTVMEPDKANEAIKNLDLEKRQIEAIEIMKKQDMSKPDEVVNKIDERIKDVTKLIEVERNKLTGDIVDTKGTMAVPAAPTVQIPVRRGSFGTEITDTFSILEKDIFGSLDGALIRGIASYPFESRMQHMI